MNTRSLGFQLTVWHAGLLAVVFVVIGGATYFGLRSFVEGDLREAQLRRARQIGQILIPDIREKGEARLVEEIEVRYAPEINNRFLRVTRIDGTPVYLSGPPKDRSFDPSSLSEPAWPERVESAVSHQIGNGRRMLVAGYRVDGPAGEAYLVESGATMDEMDSVLSQLMMVLLAVLPVVALIAAGGGFLLVKRALSPVRKIAASAERITSNRLSERLPVTPTGDEVEQLSIALNQMMIRLDEAFQCSRRFVADASHELRTPLTVLRGELEALLQHDTLSADVRDRVASLLEEAERQTHIVEGLFALSRLDAGEAQREWVRFDLSPLVATTADQMSLLAEDRKIKVLRHVDPGVFIQGDRARLKQVVVNLLDNAIKYTPEGGIITLSVQATDTDGVLEVFDTGIGIPAESLPHIFERFYRVDKARSREDGGAGLGLAISQSISTAHGGRIEVESTAGRGSTFRVIFPLAKANEMNS